MDHIEKYGSEWAMDAYEMIMEDEHLGWQLLISAIPVARTPMDRKSGKQLSKYSKELRKNITMIIAPWIEERRIQAIRERLSRPPESKVYDEHGKLVDMNDPDWWKREV